MMLSYICALNIELSSISSDYEMIISYRRPTALQDRTRDSDEDDYQDRDYDVAALANNLSQAFRYGIYSNDDMDEVLKHFVLPLSVLLIFPWAENWYGESEDNREMHSDFSIARYK